MQASISFIRSISIVLVIICHIMQSLGLELAWWFNVGVQIFLCISGFLYGKKDVGEITAFYSRRVKRILIPYYLVYVPYGLLQLVFAKGVFNFDSFVRGLVVNDTLTGAGHMWFVATILLCYVLTPLLEAYRNRFVTNQKSLLMFTFCFLADYSMTFTIQRGYVVIFSDMHWGLMKMDSLPRRSFC